MSAVLRLHVEVERQPLRLRRLLQDAGLEAKHVAPLLGVAERSLHRWMTSGTPPSAARRPRVDAALRRLGIDPSHAWEPDMSLRLVPADLPDTQESPMECVCREFLDPELLKHFGLSADPFDPPTTPDDVWMSPIHQHLEVQFLRAAQAHQIVVLAGDPGSGKSTMLRRLLARLRTSQKVRVMSPAAVDRTRVSHSVLASAILRDLTGKDYSSMALEPRSELLRRTLADQTEQGIHPVLLIDEAHLMPSTGLVAIKHFWDSHELLQNLGVLLVGQIPLQDRLRRDPALRELTGRSTILAMPKFADIGKRVKGGAKIDFVGQYLAWRLARVGGRLEDVFEPAAVTALGVRGEYPLWVNNLAGKAMLYAYELGERLVTAAHVGRV